MTTAAQIRESARAQARARLREAVLDAAYAATVADGWAHVRIGAIAAEVGVSRQTLHNEFGTKDDLGQALVLREADEFLAGVTQVLQRSGDLGAATTEALQRLSRHPLLQPIIATPADETLLPLLTSRGRPLLQRATAVLADAVMEQRPGADDGAVRQLSEVMVRLVISYAVMPGEPPEVLGPRLAALFEAGLAH